MPITEVPPSPPSAPPEPPHFRRPNRYDDYEFHELLNVIEELEGSRNWASLREKIWIALIIHLLVFWYIAYGPKYIFNVKVVDPSVVLKQREKELTYLDLPPDALKNIKPKPAPLSDKNRIAESRKPTLDKKTLEQLEAMRRAGPPTLRPDMPPSPAPSLPAPPAPQVAQAAPPSPPAQPLPQNQQSQIEAPRPAPTRPDFSTGHSTVGQDLQQMARQARESGQYGGDMGANAPMQHPAQQGKVEILSDTMGVDLGPYMQRVIYDTKRAWYPIIPEAAQPPLLKQGVVAIRFKIFPDGSVKEMHLDGPSGDVSLDRAAWGGITGAAPYPPLPKGFKGPFLELRFYFLYNIPPDQQ
ncbi:MAG: TonB family protein [Silvibacterium sp.]|nr:TonB family protein [Silvibacterium sp.]